MRAAINKQNVFKTIIIVWLVLWIFFLFREDKDGQYRSLMYMYTNGETEKMRYIFGGDFYDFLVFCKENLPEGSTYELLGIERFSIREVRARYFLWPVKNVKSGADFNIVYKAANVKRIPGYRVYKRYGDTGSLWVRKDRNL